MGVTPKSPCTSYQSNGNAELGGATGMALFTAKEAPGVQ